MIIRYFDCYTVVLTFEFGYDITILKMAIFDEVDYIDMESALFLRILPFRFDKDVGTIRDIGFVNVEMVCTNSKKEN